MLMNSLNKNATVLSLEETRPLLESLEDYKQFLILFLQDSRLSRQQRQTTHRYIMKAVEIELELRHGYDQGLYEALIQAVNDLVSDVDSPQSELDGWALCQALHLTQFDFGARLSRAAAERRVALENAMTQLRPCDGFFDPKGTVEIFGSPEICHLMN